MPDFDVMHRGMLNTLKSMQKIEAEKGKIMMGMLEADVKQGGNMMTQMLKNKLDPSKMRKQELWRGMQGGQPGPGGQPQGRPQAPPGYGVNPNFRATGAGDPYVKTPKKITIKEQILNKIQKGEELTTGELQIYNDTMKRAKREEDMGFLGVDQPEAQPNVNQEMQAKIKQAQDAGYTDEEIDAYLKGQ